MKYKPDIKRIPNTDHVRSDRQEIRRRKREVAKFTQMVDDKIWWKSLTNDQHWEIYVDYCWFKDKLSRDITLLDKGVFFHKARINYPGDVSKIRDMKIDELFNDTLK
jgi:hypothetical protein